MATEQTTTVTVNFKYHQSALDCMMALLEHTGHGLLPYVTAKDELVVPNVPVLAAEQIRMFVFGFQYGSRDKECV